MAKLFVLGARFIRTNATGFTTSGMLGYRFAESEDEARGSFLKACFESKPDFSIQDIQILELDAEALLAGLSPE